MPTHDKTKTPPERRRAPAGTTVRIDGLRLSREAWARVEALTAQLRRAGIPRARPSGALELLVLHPEVAAQVLAGGCRVYSCATCGSWLDAAGAITHQDALPGHEVQGFLVQGQNNPSKTVRRPKG
ncbi:hypothetical protein [Corallococcus aberystwythensis]|uniref:Uncharacterized protein n=1 Tax=Corallococcus aberystwythensis TaxID=2316722 RepID=A0A3A8Q5Y7_9BACT|nr:hypothetical protein [Corallococcus aberystwythensis]RKH64103.1 hypothetical protein D7W81_19070 [Corallococcus aberystwythensis]